METFVAGHGDRHSADLAALVGKRLVTTSETQKGRHWNEALINRVTGGDKISCHFMRQNYFTYTPQFTLIVMGNYRPDLASVNEANRRRFIIIPFTFVPETRDEELAEKLRAEYPAILAWMIRGARDWYENGLGELPEVVKEATESYFGEQNCIQRWIDDCCLVGPSFTERSKTLYASHVRWCKDNFETPESYKSLISNQYGFKENPSRRTARGLIGIAVNVEYEPDPRTGERDE